MTIGKTDRDIEVLHTMREIGGSFASAIALAGFTADTSNYERLKAAFPDLWEEYGKLTDMRLRAGIRAVRGKEKD